MDALGEGARASAEREGAGRMTAAFIIAPGSGPTVTMLVVAPTSLLASRFNLLDVGGERRITFSAVTTALGRLPKAARSLSNCTSHRSNPD